MEHRSAPIYLLLDKIVKFLKKAIRENQRNPRPLKKANGNVRVIKRNLI